MFAGSTSTHGRFAFKASIVVALWLVVIAYEGDRLLNHAFTPGEAVAAVPAATTPVVGQNERPILWFFIHPECPCTAASANELRSLLDLHPGELDVNIALFEPAATVPNWKSKHTSQYVEMFPDATIHRDLDGEQARTRGATTSGHVILYSPTGVPLYSGGLTYSRGHPGAGPGVFAIDEFLTTGHLGTQSAATYGCAIVTRSRGAK